MIRILFGFTLVVTQAWLMTAAAAKDETLTYDRVQLSTSATAQVENDTLVGVLYTQKEGTDLPVLANEVNAQISKAVKKCKNTPSVEVQTLGYQTVPVYDKQRLSRWRVRQAIRLESKDSGKLSQLIGDLQKTLAVQSINYSISPAKKSEVEDKLISEAIQSFNQRAKLITKQFDRSNYRLVEISISTAGTPVRPLMRGAVMAMEAEVAPPTLETGKQKVQVTINGTIEMQLE